MNDDEARCYSELITRLSTSKNPGETFTINGAIEGLLKAVKLRIELEHPEKVTPISNLRPGELIPISNLRPGELIPIGGITIPSIYPDGYPPVSSLSGKG